MENKLEIRLGDNKIIAEVNKWSDEAPNEIIIYLCNKDNHVIQDICLVRPHYEINHKTYEFETDNNFIDCIVWGDSDSEDYTEKNVIAVYEEE